MRCPQIYTSDNPECVLVSLLASSGMLAQAKCLSISPTRSELLAVGADDPYVRVYDRLVGRASTVGCSEDINSF